MVHKVDTMKKRLLKALKEHRALIATACEAANVSRTTYYNWMELDPKFAEEVENIQEGVYDKVEGILHNMIEDNNTTAVIFYSKTKMKARGYVERNEITGAEGEPVKVTMYMPENGRPVDNE